jgi:preprotein translocase subunit SecD
MPSVFGVKFEEARLQGERTVEEWRSKFRQDLGNARFIGRFSLSGLMSKLRPVVESEVPSPETDAATVTSSVHVQGSPPNFAILSASELVDLLRTCTLDTAKDILDHERNHLSRSTVMEAARRRIDG